MANHNTLVVIPTTISSDVSSHVYTFVPATSGQSAGQTYNGTSALVYSVHLDTRSIKFQNGVWSDHNPSLIPGPIVYNSSNGYVQCGGPSGAEQYGRFTSPFFSTGPTVTQTRTTHSGTILHANGFTIKNPSPGPFYAKTGIQRFQIKYYDQNEPSYNLTVTWTTASGTASDVQTVTPASGDVQFTYDFSTTNELVDGPITVSFNSSVVYNSSSYNANATVKTFQYYKTGPYTASFSPDFGLPGQSVGFSVTDTNLYPDTNTTFQVEQTPGGSLISGTLDSTNNYSVSVHPLFTSQHGTYKIYNGSTVLATATYDTNYIAPTTTSNGGGKPDRYPLIMTNLFNRNRSIYSIGMTHKDTWDLFL